MFFERERGIRAGDSHGDIVFWPLRRAAQYLIASGDAGDAGRAGAVLRCARAPDAGERATVWEHVQRALALIDRRRRSPAPRWPPTAMATGTTRCSRPIPAMREHMCSAWTVTLHFQTLTTLARALRAIGRAAQAARGSNGRPKPVRARFPAPAGRGRRADRLRAVRPTGEAHRPPSRVRRYLLHPRDETTGVHYSSLAMIHAILEGHADPAAAREPPAS